jgi:hypothetical protein
MEAKKPRRRRAKKTEPKTLEPKVEVKKSETRRYFGSGVVFNPGNRIVFDKETHSLDTADPAIWAKLDQIGFKFEVVTNGAPPPVVAEKPDPLYEPPLIVNMVKT